MTSSPSKSEQQIVALIRKEKDSLWEIAQRFSFMEEIQHELAACTRGKDFQVRNVVLWSALLDARDQSVLYFGEWVLRARNKTLFNQLRNNCELSALHVAKAPSETELSGREASLVRQLHDRRHTEFQRLFPLAACRDCCATQDDIDLLGKMFWQELKEVKEHRDDYCAHPLRGRTARAEMLTFERLRDRLEWAHQLLSSLQLVAKDQPLPQLPTSVSGSEAAQDVVDLLLIGSSRQLHTMAGVADATHRQLGKYPYALREAMYEELWSAAAAETGPFGSNGLPETETFRRTWGFEKSEEE